ncbi:DMT family transporter [Nonlabens agnitus]|uniref:EamA family transporter n=1 Tax=Nonlabens agnitus TaxID=870484 RepID=A0A2S9WT79_9FLAO|nr:DMT family transporter [Nonlabens agnitus]PRP66692.1 EamA family transporter [Nonlabens agnitus]
MKELHKAILFMMLSAFAFAIMNGLVKYLADFSAYQLVFFRSIGTLLITSSLLMYHKIPMLGNKRWLLILRGVAGAISLLLFFASLKFLPVGTAVTLRYLSPIFAAIFAVIWLKERIKPLQWLFFLLAFAGVLVLKGFDDGLSLIGLSMIILSALFMGLIFVVISKIGKQDHPMVVVNYFMFIGTVLGGLLSIGNWKNPIGVEWIWLGILGIVGFVGQLYMTKAFQIASTNQIAPLKYLEVIFTVMIGAFWFLEIYTWWSLLGILMVMAGLTLNILYKGRNA